MSAPFCSFTKGREKEYNLNNRHRKYTVRQTETHNIVDARRLPYLAGKLHRITKRGFTMIRIAIVEDDTGYAVNSESTLISIKAIFRKRSVYLNFQTDWKLSKNINPSMT